MTSWPVALLVACGTTPSRTSPVTTTGAPAAEPLPSAGSALAIAAPDPPAAPTPAPAGFRPPVDPPAAAGFPAPPEAPAPTDTWRVALEIQGLQGRPGDMVVDATGVYLAGPAFVPGDVKQRRWAVCKLDAATGAVRWSAVDAPPNGPMPDHLALADGALVVAGSESYYLPSGALVFERRDAATGKRRWHRRIAPAAGPCKALECSRMKTSLNGLEVRRGGVLYAAQIVFDAPAGVFGELALDTGNDRRAIPHRAERRGLALGADDTGLYFLEDTHGERYWLVKTDPSGAEVAWRHEVANALRFEVGASGLVLWFGAIAKHALATGQLVWTSPLAGTFTDVAVDATGVYVTTLAHAGASSYYALAELDHATGRVVWLRRSAEYDQNAPPMKIALTQDHLYLFGYEGDRWFVERRRRSDGALGKVTTQLRSLGASIAR